jgi:DNA helicase-2/ATP-dependent DNA helicase PcrA
VKAHCEGGGGYSDVAIFYRTNALSRVMEETLLKAGVPYAIARGVEFYNRKEIKDVLAYLKVLANPADDLSCRRIINRPTRGIGAVTVQRLEAFAAERSVPLVEAARRAAEAGLSAGVLKKVMKFAKMMDELTAVLDGPVAGTVERVLKVSGLEDALKGDEEDIRQARGNLAELISTAAEFDQTSEGGTLADYLHQVSLVSDVDHLEGGSGAVTLMTLHAAKGLEFPAVFVLGCEEGLLPFVRADGSARDVPLDKMEEERRLAFVGITRAQESLTLSYVRRRRIRGQMHSQTPSPFLDELPRECVEREDRTESLAHFRREGRRVSGGGFYADSEDRAVIEAMQAETPLPPEYQYLRPGCRVWSSKFGAGTLMKMSGPWPETRVEVAFDGLGQKRLVLRQASLELSD